MAIVAPYAMDFSLKNFVMIVYGLPGVGKTTFALGAKKVLLADLDKGLSRVEPEHRKDAIMCNTYEEFLSDIAEAKKSGNYETLVIDTCGALIEMMKEWAMRTEPTATKKNGGFSLQGYGVIKQEFLRLSNDLRRDFNVVYIFHASMQKNGEELYYSLIADGSTKELVWQPADVGAFCFIQNGKRYLGFTPTETYSAKSAYGIKGLIEVPELIEGAENDFLSRLFDQMRKNLKKEVAVKAEVTDAYKNAMEEGKHLIDTIDKPERVKSAKAYIDMTEVSTAKEELTQLLRNKLNEMNIGYDRKTDTYVYKKSK